MIFVESQERMRQTAFFLDSIDHMPSKQLLKQAGFTEKDITQNDYAIHANRGILILFRNFYRTDVSKSISKENKKVRTI